MQSEGIRRTPTESEGPRGNPTETEELRRKPRNSDDIHETTTESMGPRQNPTRNPMESEFVSECCFRKRCMDSDRKSDSVSITKIFTRKIVLKMEPGEVDSVGVRPESNQSSTLVHRSPIEVVGILLESDWSPTGFCRSPNGVRQISTGVR